MASGVNFGTQQYFGFNPLTVPNCQLWLDAADTTTTLQTFSISYGSYVTTTAATVTYTGTLTSVNNFYGGTVIMNGANIGVPSGSSPVNGVWAPSATSGRWYAYIVEGGYCKTVLCEFVLTGAVLTVRGISAGYTPTSGNYLSSTSSGATNDTRYATYYSATIATSSVTSNYGVQSFVMNTGGATANSVSLWSDKSGNAQNAVANTSITYNANGLGTTYPALTFTSSQWLSGPISITGTTMTIFSVFSMSSSSPFAARVLALAAPEANDYNNTGYVGILRQSSSAMGPYRNGTYTSSSTPYSTRVFTTTYFDGTNQYTSTNGGTFASNASSGSFAVTSYRVANNTNTADSGAAALYGFVGEILVYNTALTTNQRQQIEGYLAWKWGLQSSLPITHSFKRNPPAMRIFNPLDIPGGALLWLDAADTRTITGSTVTQWTDKSGRASNATTGLGSVVAGTAINSLNTLRFGYNTTLNLSNFVMPSSQTSVFYVFKGITSNANTSGGTGYFIFSRTADNFLVYSGNEQFFSYQNTPAGRSYNAVMGPGGERNWGNLSTTAFYNAVSVISMTGVSYSSSNGLSLPLVAASSISNTVFTASTYQIGTSRACCGDVYTYDLGELVACDGTISTADAQQMEGYLAWKWGVMRSLPTTHPFYKFPPATALFVPTALSNLALWFDAADSSTVTLNGTNVSAWVDKSSNAYTVSQATAGSQPAYTQNLLNGLPGVVAGGAAVYQLSNTSVSTANLFQSGANFTTFQVMNLTAPPTNDNVSPLAMTGASTRYSQFGFGPSGSYRYAFDAGVPVAPRITTTSAAMFGSNVLFSASRSATTTFGMKVNGTSLTTATVGAATNLITDSSLVLRVIWQSSGTFTPVMNLFEIIHYNRALTLAETQRVEGYLAWKWGLRANLPDTHPYYKFRP